MNNSNNWQTSSTKQQTIWFDGELFNRFPTEYFESQYWLQEGLITGESKGRYTTYFIATKTKTNASIELVLRHYYRGGLVAKISKDSFVYTGAKNTRAVKELNLLKAMLEMGLPVPRPIAAMVSKSSAIFCKNDIIIERIAGAQDLFHYLLNQPLHADGWQAVGATIKQFHQAGVFHSDLNIHNILIDNNQKIWLIDFDRCDIRSVQSSWQQANLDRLLRSLNKELSLASTFHFSTENWQQLLAGYTN